MKNKGLFFVISCNVIWGIQSLYWNLMAHMDSIYMLAMRTLFSVFFTFGMLAFTKRLPELKALFADKQKMKRLIPATVFLALDWGIFMYAVQSGHIIDTSLGYYMAPFTVFAISKFVFKEKLSKATLVAIGIAMLGVVISIVYYGRFSLISILLAFCFTVYGATKKKLDVDSTVSIAAETIMLSPIALIYVVVFYFGNTALMANTVGAGGFTDTLLVIGSGIVTALPMILYSVGIRKLPYTTMGFMQYIAPTLSFFCGLFLGESVTPDKLLPLIFIWIALAVYSASLISESRKQKLIEKNAAQPV